MLNPLLEVRSAVLQTDCSHVFVRLSTGCEPCAEILHQTEQYEQEEAQVPRGVAILLTRLCTFSQEHFSCGSDLIEHRRPTSFSRSSLFDISPEVRGMVTRLHS